MSQHHDNIAHEEHGHGEGMDKKGIWRIFFVLLALTAVEFLIALGFVHHWQILAKGALVNTIYIVLTLVKAYYIVAYFMHLKFEKSSFIVTVSIVFIFIIYFIILMLTEGNFLLNDLHPHQLWENK
ncbi:MULTISPECIES: cytochrome C oxidase subunit IV family protein [Sphingobacterium]|jgi:cytochrome c oxidase subunit 4|uniref:Cytochrome C oxidase subunit IV family protein n=1 Tax=Sphingobacterium anhuiense TaxID=493780 RepID=A0ABW5YS18_9SPHI|nr:MULTISPECIES: cytochrome C oxidase subunit IV family protein [Sphingobacterium]KKX47595.1 caa(3)-type oxidase [Sphingobacterium sp. IITKGP-BTPF85]MCW2261310.1 caa(3)-type oxidase subunit IV [Sphingobacterium kitahiroshimense]TCR07785.1 caa(3)-type oxidase subunit IV [Sphingobacterium sp. JUb78]